MFNLKRKLKQATQSFKDPKVVIAEIHESFDSASEKLLNEAKAILAGSYDIEKGERLKKVGFTSAKKVVEANSIISEKNNSKELAKLIEYYQTHYPNNKFITEDKTKEICQKYGLLCGEIQYYISDVPEKNLSEIEAFELRESEMQKIVYDWYRRSSTSHFTFYHSSYEGDSNSEYGYIERRPFGSGERLVNRPKSETHHFNKKSLKICASVKDFDTKNMRIEDGYRLELNLPDPIVLQPVNGGYLVVTKWGLESDDEDLIIK
jgi:hypothetical protein